MCLSFWNVPLILLKLQTPCVFFCEMLNFSKEAPLFLPYSFSPTTPHPCFGAFPSGCFPALLADLFELCSCFQIQNSFNLSLMIFSAAQNTSHHFLSETLFSLASTTLTFPEFPILLTPHSQLLLPHFLFLISKYSWLFFLKTFFFTSSFTLSALVALTIPHRRTTPWPHLYLWLLS